MAILLVAMRGEWKSAGSQRTLGGFTLVEGLMVVAIFGILAAFSTAAITGTRNKSSLHKLRSDIRVINAAVMSYEVFAGSLASATTAPEVLARLRSRADALSAEQTAGLTGSFIDRRLRAEMQSALEAKATAPRALWNPAKRRFDLAFSGAPGVKRFVLDEQYASLPVQEEARMPVMKLATTSNWIWDYQDPGERAGANPLNPTLAHPAPTENPTAPGTPPGNPSALQPPAFSIPSGRFPITAFRLALELSNPNPAGTSRIIYSVNNGGWLPYPGAPLALSASSSVRAFVESISPDWIDSNGVENRYDADPVRLETPVISASSSRFDHWENRSVTIALDNPNDPAVSIVSYSLNGAAWQTYTDAFQVDWSQYPEGADLTAIAIPTAEYYLESDEAGHRIDRSPSLQLSPPVIHLTPDPGDTGFVALTFENLNPPGSSEIEFIVLPVPSSLGCDLLQGRVAPEGFLTYVAAFPIDALDYSNHYAVIAYSRATAPNYIDSPLTVEYAEAFGAGIRGGHFDVDTSSTIAPVGGGSTDGHVHAYDNKFGTNIVNYFDLRDTKLHNITRDIPDPNTRFKLIVVNADLTPDAHLSVNSDPSGRGIAGSAYDDTPIESLPVYSLGGVPGTVKLEKLALYFESSAITNAGLLPTNTGDVRKNVPGKFGEWRNGAFTVQAVRVNEDGTPAFSTDPSKSAGTHGPATSGLLWESTVFWHWDGKSYHDPSNPFLPHDTSTVRDHLEGGTEEPVCR